MKKQLAIRRLSSNRGQTVTVRVGTPERVRPKEWECTYSINGLSNPISGQGRGLDAIQAIINTFASVRRALIDSSVELTWDGGERGDSGFPLYVLNAYGREFIRKLESVVGKALDAEAARLERKGSRGRKRPR